MDQGQRSALYQQLAKLIPSQVDAVAVIIGMPAEHQPASGLSAAERAKLMVDWAAQNATRLKGLQEAVEAQAGLPPSREKVQTPAATKDPFPPALSVVKYSELQQRARQTNQRLLQLAEKLNIQSMAARGRRFAEALNAGPYRVVVVGRSRAGKSTLLNALLGRDLCPVQSDLTTAVPVVVEPGLPEFARVRYQGGQFKDLDGPISAPSLAPYVDQAINVGNQKGIEEIRVRLANQSPDLGIAFIDVPGFDDPNGAIWPAAKKELERAHALILVVDVSTARDGGLALDRETIGHLKSATQRETPVFIVGNKADRLDDEEERQSTVKRLQKQLAQYQLQAPLVAGPFLIEAKKTRAAQVAGRALPSSFNEFLSILWLRLWGNDIGLRRLYATFQQLQRAGQEMETLFQVRVADEPKRRSLQAALDICKKKVATLRDRVDTEVNEVWALAQDQVEAAFQEVEQQADLLIQRKDNGAIPKVSEVRDPLRAHVSAGFEQVAAAVQEDFTRRMKLVETALKRCLTSFRKEVGRQEASEEADASLGRLPAWASLVGEPADHVADGRFRSAAVGAGVGLIAALALGPIGLLAGAAAAWIFDLFTNQPESLEELHTKVMRRLRKDFDGLRDTIEDRLATLALDIKDRLLDGAEPFLADVANYLNDNRSPTADETRLHQAMISEVGDAVARLVKAFEPAQAEAGG